MTVPALPPFFRTYAPPPAFEQPSLPSQRFLQALGFTLGQEGDDAYTDRPRAVDPGGPTKFGVTQGALDKYRQAYGPAAAPRGVQNLTEQQARQLYYRQYWQGSGANALRGPIAVAFFDTAVHSGITAADRLLTQSGGDASRFIDLRAARAARKPHAAANPGWIARFQALRRFIGSD